jgi:hypothetical protein
MDSLLWTLLISRLKSWIEIEFLRVIWATSIASDLNWNEVD